MAEPTGTGFDGNNVSSDMSSPFAFIPKACHRGESVSESPTRRQEDSSGYLEQNLPIFDAVFGLKSPPRPLIIGDLNLQARKAFITWCGGTW